MPPKINLVGQRFGRLVVLEEAGSANNKLLWQCICDCGNKQVVFGNNLRRRNTQSCGCLQSESRSAVHMRHGRAGDPIYKIWAYMVKRCTNQNTIGWKDYGGRGITVCDRWRYSFENFLADMGERPPNPEAWGGKRPYWTLDRRDYNGNYEPENCRWATPSEQRLNQRRAQSH